MGYYDSIAAGYNELHGEEQRKKLSIVIELLREVALPEGDILDVGCGTGLALDAVARTTGRACVGVEPSEGMAARYDGAQRLVVGGAEDLPFEDERFCACISITAIQNFSDITKGVMEMRRVTKRGGVLIITCLKRSPKARFVTETIAELLEVRSVQEEEKDLIFSCERKN